MVVVIKERWFFTSFSAKAMYVSDDPYSGVWTLAANMSEYVALHVCRSPVGGGGVGFEVTLCLL